MILVDTGMGFPQETAYGVDVDVPDFDFLEEYRDNIVAVVITHGHEDHIGAVPYVLKKFNVPLYASHFTMGLIESIPTVEKRGGRLSAISGVVPSPFHLPPACRFEPRCPYAWSTCREIPPDLYQVGRGDQRARCHLHTPAGAARLPDAIADHERKMNVGEGLG